MRKLIFAAFLIVSVQAYAKDVPEALWNAKTAVIINEGAELKEFQKFQQYLTEWGRFEIVSTRGGADIIIKLSSQLQFKQVRLPSTAGGLGGINTQQVLTSFIHIFDTKDGAQLWSDETPSKNSKGLVNNLKNKMKKK